MTKAEDLATEGTENTEEEADRDPQIGADHTDLKKEKEGLVFGRRCAGVSLWLIRFWIGGRGRLNHDDTTAQRKAKRELDPLGPLR